MSRQIIDTTTNHGTYTGDPAKVAFQKTNENFEELYRLQAAMGMVGGKNLLMNCGLPINQRSFAGGALALGVFGYDRWKGGSGGCNLVINASTGVWTLTGPVQQVIENPQDSWGKPLTISLESPTAPVNVYVGGATGTIPAGSGRQSITLVPGGSGNMLVDLNATGASFSKPQLERGTSATAFEYRSLAAELAMCQRFTRFGYIALRSNGTSTAGAGTFIAHQMRATPAVTFSNTVYAYGCSGIGSSQSQYGVEVFVTPTGNFAFASNFLFDAEL